MTMNLALVFDFYLPCYNGIMLSPDIISVTICLLNLTDGANIKPCCSKHHIYHPSKWEGCARDDVSP